MLRGHLGSDKDLLTGHPGQADTLTHALFVAVCLCGINVPVADGEGRLDRLGGLGIVHQPSA